MKASRTKNIVDSLLYYTKNPLVKDLKLSIDDCHLKGLFSLVVKQFDDGSLVRFFIASDEIKEFDVSLHTHTRDLVIVPIWSKIDHIVGTRVSNGPFPVYPAFRYQSAINGEEKGKIEYVEDVRLSISKTTLQLGTFVEIRKDEIHTMACMAGAIWAVIEVGKRADSSFFYGLPFTTNGLYKKATLEHVAERLGYVREALSELKRQIDG